MWNLQPRVSKFPAHPWTSWIFVEDICGWTFRQNSPQKTQKKIQILKIEKGLSSNVQVKGMVYFLHFPVKRRNFQVLFDQTLKIPIHLRKTGNWLVWGRIWRRIENWEICFEWLSHKLFWNTFWYWRGGGGGRSGTCNVSRSPLRSNPLEVTRYSDGVRFRL